MSQRPEDYLQFPQNNLQYTKPDLGELGDPVDEWTTEQSLYTHDDPAAGFQQEPMLQQYPPTGGEVLEQQPTHQDYNDVYIGAMKPSTADHTGQDYLEPMPSLSQENQQQNNSTKFPSMNLPQLHIEPATARPDLNLDISTPIDSTYGTPAMSPPGTPQVDTLTNAFSPLPSPMASPSIGPYTHDGYDQAGLDESHLGDSHLGSGNFMAVPDYGAQLNRSRSVNLEADHANLRPHSRQRSLSHTQLMSLEGRMNQPTGFNNQLSPAHTPQGPLSPRSPHQQVPPVPPLPQQYTPQRSPSSRPLSPNMAPSTLGTPQFQGQDLLAPKPDRKMRAMSDSWRNYEREAIIQSLDQNNMRQSDKMDFPQIKQDIPNSPNADSEPVNIMNFPQYGSRGYPSGATLGSDLQPPVTRHRSLSSPREPITDLKSAPFFNCSICTKTFTRAYNLRSHMRTHTDERPFACQHCGKAFARQHDKKRHEALHSGEKKFACASSTIDVHWGCGKRFARADALARHFRTEAGKLCLRPLIAEILHNGQNLATAPEGITFKGLKFGDHILELSNDEVYRVARAGLNEREEQTRRTAIYSAICDQLKGI